MLRVRPTTALSAHPPEVRRMPARQRSGKAKTPRQAPKRWWGGQTSATVSPRAAYGALALLAAGCLLALAAGRAQAASVCNFNAASGNWWDSTKWDCGHVPLSVDSVTIPSGDVATDTSTTQINVAGMTITGTLTADAVGMAGGGGNCSGANGSPGVGSGGGGVNGGGGGGGYGGAIGTRDRYLVPGAYPGPYPSLGLLLFGEA